MKVGKLYSLSALRYLTSCNIMGVSVSSPSLLVESTDFMRIYYTNHGGEVLGHELWTYSTL